MAYAGSCKKRTRSAEEILCSLVERACSVIKIGRSLIKSASSVIEFSGARLQIICAKDEFAVVFYQRTGSGGELISTSCKLYDSVVKRVDTVTNGSDSNSSALIILRFKTV